MSSGDSKYKECETVQLCHIPESFKKINSERLCQNLLVPFWSYTLELFQAQSCIISHI